MKVLSIASIFALFAAVALALPGYEDDHYGHSHSKGSVAVGGSSNEGRVNGALNNLLKNGILSSNEEISDTKVVQDYDHGHGHGHYDH